MLGGHCPKGPGPLHDTIIVMMLMMVMVMITMIIIVVVRIVIVIIIIVIIITTPQESTLSLFIWPGCLQWLSPPC